MLFKTSNETPATKVFPARTKNIHRKQRRIKLQCSSSPTSTSEDRMACISRPALHQITPSRASADAREGRGGRGGAGVLKGSDAVSCYCRDGPRLRGSGTIVTRSLCRPYIKGAPLDLSLGEGIALFFLHFPR